MIVDSYCEHLMGMCSSGIVVALPGGLSPEEFLEKMNILIKEMFSPLTIYTEEDYRSGKAILLLVKKYCFSKRTYGNAPQDAVFIEYSKATEKMIDDEIHRMETVYNAIPTVKFETLYTIIYNSLQLMSSVAAHHSKAKEDKVTKQKAKVVGVELPIMVDVQRTIHWERNDTKLWDVIPYLDTTLGITENFEKMKKNPNSPRKVIGEWAEFKYLKMVLELSRFKMEELGVV